MMDLIMHFALDDLLQQLIMICISRCLVPQFPI